MIMNPEHIIDPFEQIHPAEELSMEVAGFLGTLDDLFEEFKGAAPDRRKDEEIMQMVRGVHDQASEYYSVENIQILSLFDQVSLRLGEMACNHDHFRQSLEEHGGLSYGGIDDHSDHNHIDDDDKKKKKKKKK